MGFLADIQAFPGEYDYSRQFFSRYYRPEYTTIIVAGDVDPKRVKSLVDESWGAWKRGSYKPQIPAEPAQREPRVAHVDWPSPTLPWVAVAYRSPAFSDDTVDTAALDAVSRLAFDDNSPIYQKLVIQDQSVDALRASPPNNLDPELFTVYARVKKSADLDAVQQRMTATAEGFAAQPIDAAKLETLKQRIRYEFAMQLDNSEAIAGTVGQFVALRRTPESMNRYYDMYAKLTPDDLRRVAAKYLIASGRTVVTLTSSAAPAGSGK
jgi:zinc protease